MTASKARGQASRAKRLDVDRDASARPIRAHARYLETRVFGSLDGLRALAITAVVWQHASGWFQALALHGRADTPQLTISGRGFLGVDLFFVISGFLIVTLLLRERRRTGTISLRGFYVRRFLRIFPVYYLVLGIFAGVSTIKSGDTSAAVLRELPFAVLYLSNLVPMHGPLSFTWSLAAEEQFYVVVPGLEKLSVSVLPKVFAVAYVLLSLPPFGVLSGISMPEFFRNTTFGPILLGVILAHVLDDPRGYRVMSRLFGHWSSPLFAAVLAFASCGLPVQHIDGWPRMLIHWSFTALVAACVVQERHVLKRALSVWPVRRIGVVSYGIYLYHPLALYLVYRAPLGMTYAAAFFVAAMIVSWVMAEVSYRLFESRLLALKARFGGTRAP